MTDRTQPIRPHEWRAPRGSTDSRQSTPAEPPRWHHTAVKYLLGTMISALLVCAGWIWALSATINTMQATISGNANLSLQRSQDALQIIQQDNQSQTDAIHQLNMNMQAGFQQLNERLNAQKEPGE